MTEQEWLVCDNPKRMYDFLMWEGKTSSGGVVHKPWRPSDRKLRLFVQASRDGDKMTVHPYATWADFAVEVARRGNTYFDGATVPTHDPPALASLLREIVGNPLRPVTLPAGPPVTCHICDGSGREAEPTYGPSQVLTHCGGPTRERYDTGGVRDGHPSRWCPRCCAAFLPEHTGYRRTAEPCACCKGRRTLPGRCPWFTPTVLSLTNAAWDDGTFCPDRLAVLSDALEEAGCEEERLLRHLRGEEVCSECMGTGWTEIAMHPKCGPEAGLDVLYILEPPTHTPFPCQTCNGTGWRPMVYPHVPGCWVLDLLLNKE